MQTQIFFREKSKAKSRTCLQKVSEAYGVLSDKDAKAAYVRDLDTQVSKEDMEEASRAIEAEMEFQKAEIYLAKKSWKEAETLLLNATKLQPEEPEYKMYLAWTQYKIKGPNEANKAKEAIQKVLETRPKVGDGYYYLGMIAKEDGNIREAVKMLEQATSLKKHDVDIKRELQLLYRKQEKSASEPAKKKGGLFGRK